MIRNMGSLDRGVRAFVVAPVALVLALIVGASTVAGVICSFWQESCWPLRPLGSARTTSGSESPPIRGACTASAITFATVTRRAACPWVVLG